MTKKLHRLMTFVMALALFINVPLALSRRVTAVGVNTPVKILIQDPTDDDKGLDDELEIPEDEVPL